MIGMGEKYRMVEVVSEAPTEINTNVM